MKIIKRSGSEDIFDISKIEAAIRKANDSVIDYEALPECGGDSGYGGEPDHESESV